MHYLEILSELTTEAYAEYAKLGEASFDMASSEAVGSDVPARDMLFYFSYIRRFFKKDLRTAIKARKQELKAARLAAAPLAEEPPGEPPEDGADKLPAVVGASSEVVAAVPSAVSSTSRNSLNA
jgi:hypothetical protein